MSHVKNVESYTRIVDIYTGFGSTNIPGQGNFQAENLYAILTRSTQALTRVNQALTCFQNVNDDRKKVFVEIRGLAPRILSELKSSGVSPDTLAAAAAMVRKIQGRSLATNRPAVTSGQVVASAASTTSAPVVHARTYGRDYVSVAHHFEKLLQTVANEPLYVSGVTDLQLSGLQNKLAALQSGNAAASAAHAALGQARRDRNVVLYGSQGSLYSMAQALKNKVKAVFGANSDAARTVTHIHITKIKTR